MLVLYIEEYNQNSEHWKGEQTKWNDQRAQQKSTWDIVMTLYEQQADSEIHM